MNPSPPPSVIAGSEPTFIVRYQHLYVSSDDYRSILNNSQNIHQVVSRNAIEPSTENVFITPDYSSYLDLVNGQTFYQLGDSIISANTLYDLDGTEYPEDSAPNLILEDRLEADYDELDPPRYEFTIVKIAMNW